MIHTLNLTRGAIALLSSGLVQGGWYAEKDQATLAYRAGQMLELPEMELGKAPAEKNDATMRAWHDERRTLSLTEKQRDTAKRCVEVLLQKGSLPPGPYTCALMRELGLAPED